MIRDATKADFGIFNLRHKGCGRNARIHSTSEKFWRCSVCEEWWLMDDHFDWSMFTVDTLEFSTSFVVVERDGVTYVEQLSHTNANQRVKLE